MVDITEISTIVAAAGVLVGVVYYILDMRHQSKVRKTDLVMGLYSTFNSLEFQKTWEGILKREAKDLNDYEKIDIELIDDMFTTPVKRTWEKLRDITLEARKLRNEITDFEWFEYLYNEMKKREQKLQQLKV